ncbi:CLUMA_CG010696, isoform A [Clunio marinus]|uniref:Odorant receptor n=1 Tax=Clunio marinus TaxID=568069 RepID=A0A1J1IAJ1_9DIPT|nr:CLUMA_CG010696, isoform A [Clunio marinus]
MDLRTTNDTQSNCPKLNWKKLSELLIFIEENFRQRSAKGTLMWVAYPLIQNPCCKSLPIKTWYPVNVAEFPNYQIAYILQFFGQIYVAIGYGICGGLYVSIILLLCGQYDILYASLKNLDEFPDTEISNDSYLKDVVKPLTSLHEHREHRHLNEDEQECNQYFVSTEKYDDSENMLKFSSKAIKGRKTLSDCVEHHNMILHTAKMIENYFKWLILPRFTFTTLLLCTLAYVLSTMEEFSVGKIASLLIYMALSASELLLFTYSGELLKHHSCRGSEALMRTKWETFDATLRRDMVLVQRIAAKPIIMTAGGMFYINMNQFRSVISSAFSVFTLLQNLKEKSS